MKVIEPADVWDVRPWGCTAFRVDDVNGDGKNEVLFLQNAGCHAGKRCDPRHPEFGGYKTGVEDQELFCMTLTDGSGEIIWQTGEPWALERPYSWNGHPNEFCHVVDLNDDGKPEILLAYKGEIRIYDGPTGELLRCRTAPHEGADYIRALKTDASGHHHIFGHTRPCYLLDGDLNTVWEQEVPGALSGHFGCFADVDGDGFDEWAAGFSLFDHDGSRLWGHAPNDGHDHLDDARMGDIDDDGHFEIAHTHDGGDAVVLNDDGKERFRVQMHHCQNVLIAKFFADEPGLQLVFMDKTKGPAEHREGVAVNAEGRELSRHPSLGYYRPIRWETDVGPESLIRSERPVELDGEHRVSWVEPTGRELARFNVRSSFYDRVQKFGLDKLPAQGRYYGIVNTPAIGDVDNDGQDELLVTDRESVWVFKLE